MKQILIFIFLLLSFISRGQNQEINWVNIAFESIKTRGELKGVDMEKLLKDKLDTIYFDDQINMPEPTSDQLKEVNAYADAHRNEDTRYRINWDIIMSRIFLNHEFEIFELVLAHEIGHVLGLTHCCDFPENKCDEKFICNEIMSVGFIMDKDKHKGLYPSQFRTVYWDNYFELIKSNLEE